MMTALPESCFSHSSRRLCKESALARYDRLADWTVFVHPDAPEHQGADFPALDRALRFLRSAHFPPYWPLAIQYVDGGRGVYQI